MMRMNMTRDAYGKLGSFNTRREGSGSPPSFGRLRCAASKAVLDELLGGLKDGGTTTALGSASRKGCKAAEGGDGCDVGIEHAQRAAAFRQSA